MRSQNRETLIPIKEELKLSKGKYVQSTISSYRPQQFYNIFHKENILGEYKTKERALEVLDEIQNILQPKFILDTRSVKPSSDAYEKNGHIFQKYSGNVEIQELSTYVYEMPTE